MDRVEAIILSMTEEGTQPIRALLNPSRKQRIAKGAGVDISEVNRIVKQFEQMKKDDEAASGHDGRKARTRRTGRYARKAENAFLGNYMMTIQSFLYLLIHYQYNLRR